MWGAGLTRSAVVAALVVVGILLAPVGRARADSLPGTSSGARSGVPPAAATVPRRQLLVVGRVSRRAMVHQPRLEALADWLAPRLAHVGIRAGAAVIARTPEDMIELLRRGRVDVISDSVLSLLRYEEKAGAQPLMLEWRNGQSHDQTVFFTARTAQIFSLRDLVGRRVALEDRSSTTGFMMPLSAMIAAGLKPVALATAEAPVSAGRVGYVFGHSEANISAWVASGVVDVGAFSVRDWENKRTNPVQYREKMRLFYMSSPLLRSILAVRSGLDGVLKAALVQALRDFATDGEAEAMRASYYRVSQFTPLTGRVAQDLEEARRIYRRIRPLLD